jgi:hypothetical protein
VDDEEGAMPHLMLKAKVVIVLAGPTVVAILMFLAGAWR